MIQYWTLTPFRHILALAGARLRVVYGKPSNSAHPGDLLFDGHQNICYIEYCVLQSGPTNHTWHYPSLLQFTLLIRKEHIDQLFFIAQN